MPLALYYKPSYDRLADKIKSIAPDLDIALLDENGRIHYKSKVVSVDDIKPEYFWIHGDLYQSKERILDYFKIILESDSSSWLHTVNTGMDTFSYAEVFERDIEITNNHSQAVPISEYVLSQVLGYYQHLVLFKQRQSEGLWKKKGFTEIYNSRWTIVGFGHIGQEVAKKAKAFGAHVTAIRRSRDTNGLADEVLSLKELNQVLANTDVLVMACQSNQQTRLCIGKAQYELMKPSAVLVNVARGDLIDEDTLKDALDDNQLAYAILDVVNDEPPNASRWFWQHPKISLTPHTSNAGRGANSRSELLFLSNLEAKTKGLPLRNVIQAKDIY